MKHPEIGQWMAYLDGEVGSAAERMTRHLGSCGVCSETLAALRESSELLGTALSALDHPVVDVESTRRAVKAAASAASVAPARSAGRRWWSAPLARAAAVIVAFGVLASGLPGSPVREWLRELNQPPATVDTGADVPVVVGDPGVRLEPVDGRARVVVQGLRETGEVVVRVVDEDMLSVYAGRGASFATDAGRVLVTEAGSLVTVEFPASVEDGSVEVNGVVIYRKIGDRVETSNSDSDPASTSEIRIRP